MIGASRAREPAWRLGQVRTPRRYEAAPTSTRHTLRPVAPRVNSPRNNGASLIEPLITAAEGGGPNLA